MGKRSLLLVDGDARSLRVLEVSLKKAGFLVATAGNGREALERVKDSPPELIISDTEMPELDGFELCRQLKQRPEWASIPFVFLTGQTSIEHKIRGLELGVDEYLTKPIYIKEILTRVKILLQKQQRASLEAKKDTNTRFTGNLADMGVVDLIQTIEVSRKSGLIHISGEGQRQATLYFRNGKVIDAEAGHLTGEDGVFRLLTWSEGEFEVLFRHVRRKEVIATSTQGLLMEGMRRLDEWGRLLEQIPPIDTHFEVDYAELGDRLAELPDELNRIVRLFDGSRTVLEVIDLAGSGDLECLEIIARLYFEGFVVEQRERTEEPAPEPTAVATEWSEADTPPARALPRQGAAAEDDFSSLADGDASDASQAGLGLEEQPHLADQIAATAAEIAPPDADAQVMTVEMAAVTVEPSDATAELATAAVEPSDATVELTADEPDETPASGLAGTASARAPIAMVSTGPVEADEWDTSQRQALTPRLPAPDLVAQAIDQAAPVAPLVVEPSPELAPPRRAEARASTPPAPPRNGQHGSARGLVGLAQRARTEEPPSATREFDGEDLTPLPQPVPLGGEETGRVISSRGAEVASASGELSAVVPPPDTLQPAREIVTIAPRRGAPRQVLADPDDPSSPANITAEVAPLGGETTFARTLVLTVAGAALVGLAVGIVFWRTSADSASASVPRPPRPQPRQMIDGPTDAGPAHVAPTPVVASVDAGPVEHARPLHAPPLDHAVVAAPSATDLLQQARKLRKRDPAGALAALDKVLAEKRGGAALTLRADILLEQGDKPGALAAADEATRVAPSLGEAWLTKGMIHYELEDYPHAKQALGKYLELAPHAHNADEIRTLIDSM